MLSNAIGCLGSPVVRALGTLLNISLDYQGTWGCSNLHIQQHYSAILNSGVVVYAGYINFKVLDRVNMSIYAISMDIFT